jgi:hypothetical protein
VDRHEAIKLAEEDGGDGEKTAAAATRPPKKPEKSLVDRLCVGSHPVEASLRPERTVKLFKEAIDRNHVHIKFTDTRGGTELGIRGDHEACDFKKADFENCAGTAHIEGTLIWDYVKVRCVADIDLIRLKEKAGWRRLRLVTEYSITTPRQEEAGRNRGPFNCGAPR